MRHPRIQARVAASLAGAFLVFFAVACGPKPAPGEQTERAAPEKKASSGSWSFDGVPVGEIPPGWVVEATNERGPLATWRVVRDETAPSGDRVLALIRPNHHFGGTFNLCWTNAVSFLDGEIHVRFKAREGREDQGGGVIWRVRDKNNYYIARFNPLESNFRIYYVRDGARRTLADARATLPAGTWHTLGITQHGTRFTGSLDGKKLLEGTDDTFTEPGGVGLWTKADAATSFDDFSVTAGTPSGR